MVGVEGHEGAPLRIKGYEEGGYYEGTRVGESKLRGRRSEFVTDSVIMVPLDSASVHV